MRILLTGVSGQVGRALRLRLNEHVLFATDRVALDLAEPERIPKVLDEVSPDLIINPAAYTSVDQAEEDRDRATLINSTAPGVIARWAAGRKVPLLHFSTDYVFDGSGDRPWREDDPTNPLSIYGASKLAGEEAVRGAGGIFLIVRTSWVYAAEGVNFLGAISQLANEHKELRVVADQFGAPTSATFVAKAVSSIVGYDLNVFSDYCLRANGLVHLCAAGETSWHGFATAIVAGLKARQVSLVAERVEPIPSDQYPAFVKRPRNSRLDLSRLQEVFAISPPHWLDALAHELDLLARTYKDASQRPA